jgi:hypothetical protein
MTIGGFDISFDRLSRVMSRGFVALVILVVMGAVSASAAVAGEPWLHLAALSRPGNLPPEASGEISATVLNIGDGSVDASAAPLAITVTLPAGLHAVSVTARKMSSADLDHPPVPCALASAQRVECSFVGVLAPYQQLEVSVKVAVQEGAASGEQSEVAVSGGGAPSASLSRPITISESPTPFGVGDYRLNPEEAGGALGRQAGSHPFQLTTTFDLNQVLGLEPLRHEEVPVPAAMPKDLAFRLPAGLIGSPLSYPRCTMPQFSNFTPSQLPTNECPLGSVIGVASVLLNEDEAEKPERKLLVTVPIFNLTAAAGEPARFGFEPAKIPVLLDTSLRAGNGEDYGVTVHVTNVSEQAGLLSSTVTFWGVPGDSRHDSLRGTGCIAETEQNTAPHGPCVAAEEQRPAPFLSLPTSCAGPLQTSVEAASWDNPGDVETFAPSQPLPSLIGCGLLPFQPVIAAEPTSNAASSPTGFNFELGFDDEGLRNAEGLVESQAKKAVITLPEGFTANPSLAAGLKACSRAEYDEAKLESGGCTEESKIGEVTIESPLIEQKVVGGVFVAKQGENPYGNLLTLYVIARNPEIGVIVKQALKLTPDPVTGQLTTEVDQIPQLPFSKFHLAFRPGQRAPLITPPACGVYSVLGALSPWSVPASFVARESAFQITQGPEGLGCPSGGVQPFRPGIAAGTLNNNAGGFSAFDLRLTRTDAEAEIAGFSTDMPPGLTGDLSGLPFCPEADIALARTRTGSQEETEPSCPAASKIGHTLVGTGAGTVLAYSPGSVYFAGPYHGAPFSIVSVTSAVVGPFDLGTVVLRFGLNVDQTTAQVHVSPTSSEPIPTIIDGIVTHVRDIRVYIDRPNFILNPTSCNPMAISSKLASNVGQNATVSSRFQAANCASLKFGPKFTVSTNATPSKAAGASLTSRLEEPKGALGTQANISKFKVELPLQLPSQLKTLQKACLDKVFNINPAGCPPESIVGHATVHTPVLPVPLTGPAYFVSHGNEDFPSLTMVLQGYGVKIELVGSTLIRNGVTSTTFKTVPDVPFETFELTLPQGKYAALAANLPAKANGSFCGQKLVMPTEMIAQNGTAIYQKTPITVTGCPKTKTRAQKLAAALKACHKKHGHKRTTCERTARKRYGPVKKKR